MQRIGVFICHCGTNIAATVDVKKVVEAVRAEDGVVYATHSERDQRAQTDGNRNRLLLPSYARSDVQKDGCAGGAEFVHGGNRESPRTLFVDT